MKVTAFRFKMYPNDFDKMRAFYASELGFKVVHEWNRSKDDRGVMFDVGGTTLELLTREELYQPLVGCDLSLEVDDVHELYGLLKDKEYTTRELRHNPWGDTSFGIVDPEGLQISLFTEH
jgi:catechol 2,3-dioxygenase-like lactoylglutathione lyase family enzyme